MKTTDKNNHVTCVEIATKKVGYMLFDEPCGCVAKIEIQYELRDKLVNKTLCMRHYKSVISWLNKINTDHAVLWKAVK